eukprot:355827-Chlamydomonas_euryale.AAC.14
MVGSPSGPVATLVSDALGRLATVSRTGAAPPASRTTESSVHPGHVKYKPRRRRRAGGPRARRVTGRCSRTHRPTHNAQRHMRACEQR